MNTLVSDEDKVMIVWNWCSDAYLQHGIRLKLPANTDPATTYQWRYAKAIANKFEEWGFDDATSQKFIQVAVNHCKRAGVIHKGLASLHQANMLSVCLAQMKKRSDSNTQSIDSIKGIHQWLSRRIGVDALKGLLHRSDTHELCNIVKWYKANRISRLYLALSRPCLKSLDILKHTNQEERDLLPSKPSLFLLRSEFLEEANNVQSVKQILGEEWR